MKRVWKLTLNINGFETFIMIEGTEDELRDYYNSEIPLSLIRNYRAMTDKEIQNAKKCNMPIYLVPEL